MAYFDSVRDRLIEFKKGQIGWDVEARAVGIAIELDERLRQLEYLLEEVRGVELLTRQTDEELTVASTCARELKRQGREPHRPPLSEVRKKVNTLHDQWTHCHFRLRLNVESFYYFAERIRVMLRAKDSPFPELRSFDPKGVRDVRNRLIQHPEGKDSQAYVWSIGYGGTNGPYIKPARSPGQPRDLSDKGLYENIAEFRHNLEQVLDNAIKKQRRS